LQKQLQMKYINRAQEAAILKNLKPNKVVVLLGARRVGKTELINHILKQVNEEALLLNGEDEDVHELLRQRSTRNYERLLGKKKLLVIDEAQAIPEIGIKLKLMVDTIKGIKVLVTGSSMFDLNNQLGEPLVGRKKELLLYPLSQLELSAEETPVQTKSKLEERLVLGSYPELEYCDTWEEKIEYLKEQVNAYLLKDILAFEGIQKREKIVDLLRILAFRVGSEISIEDIGNKLQISKNTVDRYLDLLSKVFIIHNVSGFSRNLDNEITKKSKWYFYDNGLRNALINNFNRFNLRDDVGKLWENYIICERLKYQEYKRMHSANFFWRTHTKQEIDWVEDRSGTLYAYEIKWGAQKSASPPSLWGKHYPKAKFEIINSSNYLNFIT
jgi:predicted AAA+ superfamily ATPase